MNRLEKKTTATLLIAIFMISAFAVAIPVMAATNYFYGFQISYPATDFVELSTEHAYLSTQSVRQEIAGGDSLSDARVTFNYDGTLGSLVSVDFWGLVLESTHSGPYVSISIDTDDVLGPDFWVVQASQYYAPGVWEGDHGLHEDTQVAVTESQVGGVGWEPGFGTFADLMSLPPVSGDYETFADCPIVEIKVGIGTWGPPNTNTIAFVDDVTIVGYLDPAPTENFEPTPTGDVLVTTNADGYTLDVTVDGTGTVDIDPLDVLYPIDDPVSLLAKPGTDWHFDCWSGDFVGLETDNPMEIIMDGNKELTAHFVVDIVSIRVTPTSVDFGDVMMGDVSGVEYIKIENMGNVDVTVSADIDEGEGTFYSNYLLIGGAVAPWSGSITQTMGHLDLDLVLDLALCRESGIHEGTLIFTAVETD